MPKSRRYNGSKQQIFFNSILYCLTAWEDYEQSSHDVRSMRFRKNNLRETAGKKGFVRLSIDEEMWRVYGQRGLDFPENQYEALSQKTEIALREKMIALINEGRDIVLDFSFWNKKDRDTYRSVIRQAGGTPQLIYMKASKEVLKKRLQKRNQTLNANSPFIITDEILDHHFSGFQEPAGENEIILQQS